MAGTLKRFSVAKDNAGSNTLIAMGPTYVDAYVFASASSQNITVPAGAAYAIFGQNNSAAYYVKQAASAAVPVANVTDGTASMCRMDSIQLDAGVTTISIATDGATIITIAWYTST